MSNHSKSVPAPQAIIGARLTPIQQVEANRLALQKAIECLCVENGHDEVLKAAIEAKLKTGAALNPRALGINPRALKIAARDLHLADGSVK